MSDKQFAFASLDYPGWSLNAGSLVGRRHLTRGDPNDDSFALGKNDHGFWLIAADGVSTSANGRAAARIAAEAAHAVLRLSTTLDLDDVYQAFATAHKAIAVTAGPESLGEFATTLAIATVTPNVITCGNIGDSSITSIGQNTNHTTSLCSAALPPLQPSKIDPDRLVRPVLSMHLENWKSFFRYREAPPQSISGLIVSTDGADDYISGSTPTLLPSLLASKGPKAFSEHLSKMLAAIRSNDDATVLVALKAPA